VGRVQYRLFYFFYKRGAVLTHGCVKPGRETPPREINRTIAYRERFLVEHRRYATGRSDREARLEQIGVTLDVGQKVDDVRTRARLTPRQLAERVGTTASAICRLEDASYAGHSLVRASFR